MAEEEKKDDEYSMLTALVPKGLVHMSFGYVFGKWNVWAQVNSYWYRGTHENITEAYTQMLGKAGAHDHVSKVVNPLDGRTKEAKRLKEENEVNFKEDF